MSKERLVQFNQVLSDPALQVTLSHVTSREDFMHIIAEAGKEKGFNFTTEDVEQEIRHREEEHGAGRWISDELLESVAGHQSMATRTGTCTCQGCSTFSTMGCHTGSECRCDF